jgi:hypothetical protein
MDKPIWWPKNPYPEWMFPMTDEEYIDILPDPMTRTAVSGYSGRWAWQVAETEIWERLTEHLEELEAKKEEAE